MSKALHRFFLDHVAIVWVGMIHPWSGHAACLCEVKNVVARFTWRHVMWRERVNVVTPITWRQRDVAWSCGCSGADHVETAWCGVIVWSREGVKLTETPWCGLVSCWHRRGLSSFLVDRLALLDVLDIAFVMLCGEWWVMIPGLLGFCQNAHPSFFPFHFRFGSCWWVFVKDVLGS